MTVAGEIPERNGTHPVAIRRLNVNDAIRRRPLLAFGTPLTVVALTLLFLLWVRPLFQTTALIRIDDEEQGGVPMLQALQFLSAQGSELQTEIAVLQSRTLAEEVAKETALQVTLVEPPRTPRLGIVSASGGHLVAGGDLHAGRTAPGPFDAPRSWCIPRTRRARSRARKSANSARCPWACRSVSTAPPDPRQPNSTPDRCTPPRSRMRSATCRTPSSSRDPTARPTWFW